MARNSKVPSLSAIASMTGPCHFVRIPAQLRLEIYRHVLPTQTNLRPASKDRKPRHHLNILGINRQIYDAAYDVLYGNDVSKFELEFDNSIKTLNKRMCANIRKVELTH